MKKILLFLLFPFCSFADTWIDPTTEIEWSYVPCDGQAIVGGDTRAVSQDIKGNLIIPQMLGGYRVTSIGDRAFSWCSGLKSVTIPSSVTNIGYYAFENCRGLLQFVVDVGNLNYQSVDGLLLSKDGKKLVAGINGDVTIPSTVTRIGDGAFSGYSGLTSVKIPSSVTNIGMLAFHDCSGLCSVTIPSSVARIGYEAFCYCTSLKSVIIPSSVTSIGELAFWGCGNLINVTIPSSVTSIGEDAFRGTPFYDNLPNGMVVLGSVVYKYKGECPVAIRIPSSVTSIGSSAFRGCSGLTSVTIPAGVKSIGLSAFCGCSGLTSVTIPSSVTSIGSWAFWDCSSLTSVTVPGWKCEMDFSAVTNLTISEGTVTIKNYAFSGCSRLMRVTIPTSVTNIGESAFYGCSGLTGVTMPTSVISIGESAFRDCSGLTSVAIPTSVTNIGDSAFSGCSGLTSVTIPSSVTSIGSRAFLGCSGLTSIEFAGAPPSGLSSASINTNIAIRYNDAYKNEWHSVIMESGFVNANAVFSDGYGYMEKVGDYTWTFSITNREVEIGVRIESGKEQWKCAIDPKPVGSMTTPEMLGGRPVSRIGCAAFKDCSGLTSVMIPDGVTSIGSCAFVGCTSLRSANLPETVLEINGAFELCDNLEYIYLAGCGRAVDFNDIAPEATKIYITPSTMNWNFSVPGKVAGCTVDYCHHPLKEVEGRLEPTCCEIGYERICTCKLCGSVVKENVLPALGHDWQWREVAMMPTTNKIGWVTSLQCRRCGELREVDFELLPAEGHGDEMLRNLGYDDLPTSKQAELSYDEDGFMIWQGWVFDYQDREATRVVVPEGVVGIGREAFAEMYDLEEVVLPSTLKYIASDAFFYCASLDGVIIPDGVEEIGDRAFKDCSWMQTITFGKGLKRIGEDAFKGCTQLQKVVFQDGLEEISEGVFDNCFKMQSAAIPLSVTNIAWTAFTGCSSLTGVTTPTHGGTMANWFGPIYTQVKNVTVPAGEAVVIPGMFAGCSALQSVSFSDLKDSEGNVTNGVTVIGAGAFQNCTALTGVTLPEALEEVGGSAFKGCTALATLAFPDGVTALGTEVCRDCSALKELTLSRSLTAIPDRAFYGCFALDSFTVPESVSYLGSQIVSGSADWWVDNGTRAIYFLGNAPSYASDVYGASRSDLVSYVVYGTRGWDGRAMSRDLPQQWPTDTTVQRGILTWSPNPFDVTFDATDGLFENDGSTTYACQQITYTAYALPPYNPKRTGYLFDGWWTERSGGTQVTPSTRVTLTKAHTLYAHWNVAGDIRVRFNATGGTVSPEYGSFTAGGTYGELPVPTREYWDFDGWWTQTAGGTQIKAASEVPTADVELFAHWVPATYKIIFHAENGGYGSYYDMYTQTFKYGDTVTLWANTWTCGSATFGGWALEPGGKAVYADQKTLTDLSDIRDGELHLYAVWIGDTYAVRFDSNGGKGKMANQTMIVGVTYYLNTNCFRRTGYVFQGWATDPAGSVRYSDGQCIYSGFSAKKGDTVKLYAVWKVLQKYTVTFNAAGGTCATKSRTVYSGNVLGKLPVPVRSGYRFAGWRQCRNYGNLITETTVVSYSFTCYASWEQLGYVTITFDKNGGVCSTRAIRQREGVASKIPTATKSGYVFMGWYTSKTGGEKLTSTTQVTCDVTYYARYGKASALKPKIDCVSAVFFTPGIKLSVPVQATSELTPSVSAKPLPDGLKYYSSGKIYGTPKACSKAVTATVTAKNAAGTATKQIVFTPVNPGFAVTATVPTPDGTQTVVASKEKVRPYLGVNFELALAAVSTNKTSSSYAVNKVSVSGLKNGLSFDETTGKITGVPTKTGKQTVKATFTNKWGWSTTFLFYIYPKELPAWLVGDYNGCGKYGSAYGTSQLSVGSTAKTSGKIVANGSSYSFSVNSFASCTNAADGAEIFTARAKVNSKYYALFTFAPTAFGADGTLVGAVTAESEKAGKAALEAYQDAWSVKDLVPVYKSTTLKLTDEQLAQYGSGIKDGDALKMKVSSKKPGTATVTGTLAGKAVTVSAPVVVTEIDEDGTALGEIVFPYGKKNLVLPVKWLKGEKLVLNF